MGNAKTITLIDGYRQVADVEMICAFEVPELTRKYIIYTKNERDKDGNTIIYAGRITTMDNKQFIENIEEGREWDKLKNIMKTMSKHSLEGEKYV